MELHLDILSLATLLEDPEDSSFRVFEHRCAAKLWDVRRRKQHLTAQ